MDIRSWKKVLLEWITECGFLDRNYYNIEQSDIDVFYQNFALQHQKTANDKFKQLTDFLKEFYPEFEINFDDENCLSSADYVYVYSLLLHFCCVKSPEKIFHEICKRLPVSAQQSIKEFFKDLLDTEPITKEILRHAIADVANIQVTPPGFNDSFSSGATSVSGGQNSSSFSRSESPMKTPKGGGGAQRISPSTPKTHLLEERTRELYNLRAQLETERYEKGLLEIQIKQNEDEIHKLNTDHKKLLQQIQDLKNEMLLQTNDGSANRDDEGYEIRKRVLKELSQKEQDMIRLLDSMRTLREEKTLVEKKLNYADKQIILSMVRLGELESKVNELTDNLNHKENQIKYLTNSKLELEQYISEIRSSVNPNLNVSADCLDSSFSPNNNNSTNGSNSLSSPENLGVSVIDVQLKEKIHENQQLKTELYNIQGEHKRLTKQLTKLVQDFDLPFDNSSPNKKKRSQSEEEEENSSDDHVSSEEQFQMFNSCLEKIDKFHKTQKNKIKQLEQQSSSLQEKNESLKTELRDLTEEVKDLKENLTAKEQLQRELEKFKTGIELLLEKSQNDLVACEKQKNKFLDEVRSLQFDKESLNEDIKQLEAKIELKHQETEILLTNNRKLNENEQYLQTQLQQLQSEFSLKTLQWEEKSIELNETIQKQIEDIEIHKQTEETIKYNYEQMVVKNEELKKETRQANTHLCDIRIELQEKENQLISLGEEINGLKQNNQMLEENINRLMVEHKQEMHKSSSTQKELHKQITKYKDQLTKTQLLLDSKQHECELKGQTFQDTKTKILKILKHFNQSNEGAKDDDDAGDDDILDKIEQMSNHIEEMLKSNENMKSKVLYLQEILEEATTKSEELIIELQRKSHDLEKDQQEILSLKASGLAYEKNIEQLQQQQYNILEKAKHDLEQKETELQERLSEAASEYDASMERIAFELKLEKQHHNNKEMELIVIKAEHQELKKKLDDADKEIQKLHNDVQQLQQSCERLKQFESRVIECSEENNKLRHEILAFKQQVTQNALRLLEADKALAEFMELTKQQDTAKSDIDILQNKLQERDNTLMEMELKLQQQSLYEEQIKQFKQQLEEQKSLMCSLQEQVEKLGKDKERLKKEVEEKSQQIQKEQQDKLLLLSSLEKSTDQCSLAVQEKQEESSRLEQKLQDLKEQYENLTLQNTKLQGSLVEREAELRLSLDEQQQEKEDFEQKLAVEMKNMKTKSDQLESLEIFLIEIVALMENNFNLTQELAEEDVVNVFSYQENNSDANLQTLRKHLNHILIKQQKSIEELQKITAQKEELIVSLATLKDSNDDLTAKLSQQEKTLKETEKQLENEELIVKKRALQEVKRLEEDLLNLEKVNEHLANENAKIQVTLSNIEEELNDSRLKTSSLEKETLQLKEAVHSKSLLIEKLQQADKNLRNTLKEKSRQMEVLLEKSKQLETHIREKTACLQYVERENQDAKIKAQKHHQSLQAEQKKLHEKLKSLQTANDSLETQVGNKNKELLVMKNKNSERLQQHKELEQELKRTSQKLDEMVTNKLNAETKCEQLQSEVHQLKRDLDFTKTQLQSQQEDHNHLNQEINSLNVDKQHLRDEVNASKLSLQCANDNVTQLIQQISSTQLEKEAALEENLLLRKQLEETGKSQTSSETKLKSIREKSQEFERKLLSNENEIKLLKINLEKSQSCTEKLQVENKKLRDSQDASTKRIEKLALKLGDSQAKSSKLERENEKLSRTLEAHAATAEALQKEKDLLHSEAKTLKERLSRAERGHEQLAAKVQNLEHLNITLQQIKQKLEASEIDGKTKLNKLEKMREASEEKIRKLTNSLNNVENVNVKLNLEIGALNSQLKEVKIEHKQENALRSEELQQKLTEALDLNNKYEEVNEKLKVELSVLKEENCTLKDQLSKACLSLQITSQKCERFAIEMEQIRTDLLAMRQEKSQIQLQHETSLQKLNQFETRNIKLVHENKNLIKNLEQKIAQLEENLAAKSKKVLDLQKEIDILNENSEILTQQNTAINVTELQDLRAKLSLAEESRTKEQQTITKLQLDNQILHTKYQEAKQRALDSTKSSDERIKENRLELEGKLEKMKNKMKTLYTEEITKMKTKQDRETAVIKSEMEVLKAQNSKYEEHIRKLSSQIVRLNENILQHQKENTILSTKLKHLIDQLHECERNRRPTSIHISTISTAPGAGANLAMEDEEGEVFNNTYLTDLQNGRMSELMSRDVCVEELKYRNSLLPPHLRSSYAAQFDHEFPEDDLKDGPHSFDDSMSALLSTTVGGTRKKCTGVTHYKRPGPPTPSKNGGRLSFGGCSEPAREILKESYDTNVGSTVSSSKTPARFNFFASRFSMGNTKDEASNIETAERNVQTTSIKGITVSRKRLAGVGCTSTPRKSKVHYDQRRLLEQLMKSSPSPSPLILNNDEVKITPPDVSIIETPVTTLDAPNVPKIPVQKSITKRLEAIAGGLRRSRRNSSMFGRRLSRRMQEICTPTSGETTSSALSTPAAAKDKIRRQVVVSTKLATSESVSKTTLLQKRLHKRPAKEKGARPSLYLRGNIFAKYRTPNRGVLRDLNCYKSRKQRLEHFNKGRNINSFKGDGQEDVTDKTISCAAIKDTTYDLKNNNYVTFTRNKLPGDTVVLTNNQHSEHKLVDDTFTFAEERYEQPDTDDFDYIQYYESERDYDGDDDEIICRKQKLVTTQDLKNFDRFVASAKPVNKNYDYSCQDSSQHFEKLLVDTESNAPFKVQQFNERKSSSNSQYSSHLHMNSQTEDDSAKLTTATPHLSPNNPSCQLSRTIYGGTVIYNHRLPNINTTYVRKSSIYVKNRKGVSHHSLETSSCNDIVLITNQTITFVDIMRMWSQMDNPTRIIVSFAILASLTTLLGLVVSFYSRR